jgi:Peptidase dimerisation domain.
MRGHRGRAEVFVDLEGVAEHAALSGPENALYDLAEYLLALKALPPFPGLKITPTRVDTFPGARNQTPGVVRLYLDVRYEPGTELEFVIMVIAVSCVKLLSAHNSTQHTSRKHKV